MLTILNCNYVLITVKQIQWYIKQLSCWCQIVEVCKLSKALHGDNTELIRTSGRWWLKPRFFSAWDGWLHSYASVYTRNLGVIYDATLLLNQLNLTYASAGSCEMYSATHGCSRLCVDAKWKRKRCRPGFTQYWNFVLKRRNSRCASISTHSVFSG